MNMKYLVLILIICVGWNYAFPASTAILNNTNSYSIKGGTFAGRVSPLIYSVGTCDINGDGKKDIIFNNGDGYVVLFGDISRFGNSRPIND
ncbi:hypothetical protein DLAC_00597 [Tieghemostelium lacteum]|uniref:Tenascin X n=1 Tax=Tieghemostelium lacteum TaxID=361077 RepID=A0A152AA51_TIELA|nr:hypothetical protein DLAC_00597 [Tieghemostelium lacteum]|eukprot:KYR03103.1 hypothetical protein DLAC_00597 [Tieghemostelium lacteum]